LIMVLFMMTFIQHVLGIGPFDKVMDLEYCRTRCISLRRVCRVLSGRANLGLHLTKLHSRLSCIFHFFQIALVALYFCFRLKCLSENVIDSSLWTWANRAWMILEQIWSCVL
jgi:hypothetical protein